MVHTESFTNSFTSQLTLDFSAPPVQRTGKRIRLVNVPNVCEHCKEGFLAAGKQKFCSRVCFGKAQSIRQAGEGNASWKSGLASDNYRYKRIQRERYPERINARQAVHHALRAGKLVKQPCACGSPDVVAHHHQGYDRANRLNVLWRCATCHREDHGGMKFASKQKEVARG